MVKLGVENKVELVNSVDGKLSIWWRNNGTRRRNYVVVLRSTLEILSYHNTVEVALKKF